MKRILFFLSLVSFISCTNEAEEPVTDTGISRVVMQVHDYIWSDSDSRVSIDVTPSGIFYYWADNDTVGIYPDKGTQIAFPVLNGAGTTKASFTGGAWALKPSSRYAAYYPFIKRLDFENTAVPVCYDGQVQDGLKPTFAQGKYNFMAAVATTPSAGLVMFDFKNLNSILELNIPVPEAGTLTSVSLHCDEAVFARTGSYDLTVDMPAIKAVEKVSSIKVDVTNVKTTAAREVVKIYLLMAPTDLTGKNITAEIVNNGKVFVGKPEVKKPYRAGHAYKVPVKFKTEPVNQIMINAFSANNGSQIDVPVVLENDNEIEGFQFDLVLPDGIVAKGVSPNLARLGTHYLDANLMHPGEPGQVYRVLCYSANNALIKGTSGTVATISFSVGSMPLGNHEILMKNIVLVGASQSRIETPDMKTILTIK